MQKDKFLNLPFLFSRLHLADDNCDVAETFQSFSQQDLFCRWQNVKAVKTSTSVNLCLRRLASVA